MVTNNDFRGTTSSTVTKYHFVTDLVKKKFIELNYYTSEEMIADMMTKALGTVKIRKCREDSQLAYTKINNNR